jgi:hypothetical protein
MSESRKITTVLYAGDMILRAYDGLRPAGMPEQ